MTKSVRTGQRAALALDLDCPRCQAQPGAECTTTTGAACMTHTEREPFMREAARNRGHARHQAETLRDLRRIHASDVTCPTCGAQPGDGCTDLRTGTKCWVHTQRRIAASNANPAKPTTPRKERTRAQHRSDVLLGLRRNSHRQP